ncbi:phospho-sugar mutase [Helicobacter sp. 16-1353]|nr:phospho-sugar mutase [Helicobacter sp. 16-1353]
MRDSSVDSTRDSSVDSTDSTSADSAKKSNARKRAVAIGYDARIHSPTLFNWLSQGIASEGLQIYFLGMIPTPVAYFSLYHDFGEAIDASIMITGSHNPPQYNGFKITMFKAPFYGKDIANLGKTIESQITQKSTESSKDYAPEIINLPALEKYIDFLTTHFKHLANFKEKIAVDCGNGVAGIAIKKVLENLKIDYLPLYFKPDGSFPNHHPDPSEEKNLSDLKNAMKKNNIKIGIAFDGDADRLALLSENYSFKGDELAILFAKKMAKEGVKPLIIGEVKCSAIMYEEINKIGKAIMHKTGHSNLKVKLKETNAHLAAEMSGHIFFNDRYFGYDDAIYSSFRALELFLDSSVEEVESAIKNLPKMYSTPEEKIESSEEKKFQIIQDLALKLENPPKDFPKILEIITIDGLRVVFENGWGLIRASNTTPVLVTRFEAKSKDLAELYKNKLLGLIGV